MKLVLTYTSKLIILGILLIVTAGILLYVNPIPQDQGYHVFADSRVLLGINNFCDVLSNIPFLLVGYLGLKQTAKMYRVKSMTNFLMQFTLFSGAFLTAFGSAYYHYSPDNFTLIWDRLPMTLLFTSFFSMIIFDYIDKRIGAKVFYPFVLIGVYSVIYWYYTEITGVGDLRLYSFVQFFPIICIPLILLFFNDASKYTKQMIYVFGCYTLAKLFEHFDHEVFDAILVVSGHTLKHLFSALAVYYIYKISLIRINY